MDSTASIVNLNMNIITEQVTGNRSEAGNSLLHYQRALKTKLPVDEQSCCNKLSLKNCLQIVQMNEPE